MKKQKSKVAKEQTSPLSQFGLSCMRGVFIGMGIIIAMIFAIAWMHEHAELVSQFINSAMQSAKFLLSFGGRFEGAIVMCALLISTLWWAVCVTVNVMNLASDNLNRVNRFLRCVFLPAWVVVGILFVIAFDALCELQPTDLGTYQSAAVIALRIAIILYFCVTTLFVFPFLLFEFTNTKD
jgi:hypothetical protein